jgi:hypothetical protein
LIDTASIDGENVTPELILYHFLCGIMFEISPQKIDKFMPFFMKDLIEQNQSAKDFTKGFSQFVQNISDGVADLPILP